MQEKRPYANVRLIQHDDGNLNQRFEIRVSTFVQFDDNADRCAISGHPTKEKALELALQIARCERIKTT